MVRGLDCPHRSSQSSFSSLSRAARCRCRRRVLRSRRIPAWYGPRWGAPYALVPYTGDLKIKTNNKNAGVFIDGGYAGQTAKLKKFALSPGVHNIELRDPSGHAFYQKRIQVIPGKTLEIHADSQG